MPLSDFDLPTLAPSWTKTRHEVEVFALTWNAGPVYLRDDIASLQVSKDLVGVGSFQVRLWPRVPTGVGRLAGAAKRPTFVSYLDLFRPNDWLWIFVNPHDDPNRGPECLFIGCIDRVFRSSQIDDSGTRRTTVTLAGSGFAKCLAMTHVVADAWMLDATGIQELYSLVWNKLPQIITKLPMAVATVMKAYLSTQATKEPNKPSEPPDVLLDMLTNDPDRAKDFLAMASQTAEKIKSSQEKAEAFHLGTVQIKGQFEVPVIGRTLWSILKLEFENIPEMLLTLPGEWFQHFDAGLLDTLRVISNAALNELFFDVRHRGNLGLDPRRVPGQMLRSVSTDFTESSEIGPSVLPVSAEIPEGFEEEALNAIRNAAGSIREEFANNFSLWTPYAILRRRPLFQDEIAGLPGPTLRDVDLIVDEVGYSDAEVANLCFVTAPVSPAMEQAYRAQAFPNYVDPESVRRHGLRLFQARVPSVPADPGDTEVEFQKKGNDDKKAIYQARAESLIGERYSARLFHAYRQNAMLLSGTITLPRLLRDVWLGSKLMIARRNLEGQGNATLEMYYVEAMTCSWTYPGPFYHGINLTRGRSVDGGYEDFAEAARKVTT